jgi:hypothetical protein
MLAAEIAAPTANSAAFLHPIAIHRTIAIAAPSPAVILIARPRRAARSASVKLTIG